MLNYLLGIRLKDNGMLFLLALLRNRNTRLMEEHHFHHILAFMLNYEGSCAWEVGLQFAGMVREWGPKYKNVYQQLSHLPETTYSQRIKKLAVQLYFGRPFHPLAVELERDVACGILFASEYQQRLNDCSRVLTPMEEYEPLLAEGLTLLSSDCYLSSFL